MMEPYIGLRYFKEKDAELFYGRDEHVAELLGKLAGNRFVAVLGSSGSGKSSMVRAGLLPELRAGMIPEAGSQWKVVEFKPGRAPLGALADALQKALGVDGAREMIEEGPLGIARVVQAAALGERTNVLILADQFEEVFRFQQEDGAQALEEGQALVRRLLDAAAQTEVEVYVLMVMRSDYLGECAQFPELPERMSESLYLVPRLRRDQLEEAITAPVGGRIEPALVQRLLTEVGSDPDQLPRLQHLLLRMWLLGEPLTMAQYESRGGWAGGLDQHLDEVYRKLPDEACAAVFRQLSEMDKGRAVRRRASLGDLVEIAGPEASLVVERFRAEGFLAPEADPVDITHECILREWPRVRGWMEKEERDEKRLRELADAARDAGWPQWTRALSGLTLENLASWWDTAKPSQAWAQRYGLAVEEAYLIWSRAEDERLKAERDALENRARAAVQERLETERRQALERNRRARWTAVNGMVVLGFAGLGGWAWAQKSLANVQGSAALTRQLVSRSELVFGEGAAGIERAALLATSSLRLQPTFDGDRALRRQLSLLLKTQASLVHEGKVLSVAWSPDGKRVATGSEDKTARVMDASTGQEVARLAHEGRVLSVSWSPDGKRVATGGDDNTARVMDASTGQEVARLAHQDTVWSVAWGPDGKRVATGSGDKTARVMDASTGQEVARLAHHGVVWSVAWSPDGKRVATGSDDLTARVMEASTGKEVARLAHQGPVWSVAWSPDGKRVATGSEDKTVRVIAASTGKEAARLVHQRAVRSVAWSPDGKRVASGSDDGTARLIDASSGKEVARLSHQGRVIAVAWSPDGKRVATGSEDKTTRLMDASTGLEVARMVQQEAVFSIAWSADGKRVATGSGDKTAQVMDASAGHEVARFAHDGYVKAVAWSPDGKRVATGSEDSTARVMDASTGQEVARLAHQGDVWSVAWSPDGKRVATGSGSLARVMDASTGQEVARFAHEASVLSVAWSPDGKRMATGSGDMTARVMDAFTGQEVARLAHEGRVLSVAWSPDGKRVATGSSDMTARVMDATTGKEMARLAHEGSVFSVAWSPDGKRVATGSADKTARVMDASTGQELARLAHEGFVAWSPDSKWVVARSGDLRVMDAATGEERVRIGIEAAGARFSSDGRSLEILGRDATGFDLLLTRHTLDPQALIREACSKVTRNLTLAEWHQYAGKETPYARSCDNLPFPPDYKP